MYCSSCGAPVAQSLSYCNRCGAKVGGAKGDGRPTELSLDHLVAAVAAVFVFGLAAFVGLLALMKEGVGFNPVILVAAALSFLLTVVVEAVLVWLLLSGRRRARREEAAAPRPEEQTTRELGGAQARSLPEGVPSVTEHTTRAFDPVRVERKS